MTHTIRSQEHAAREVAEEFCSLASQQPDSGPRMMGHRLLGVTLFMLGELAASQQEFRQALELYDAKRHRSLALTFGQEPRATPLCWSSLSHWLTGDLDAAERTLNEAAVAAAESECAGAHR